MDDINEREHLEDLQQEYEAREYEAHERDDRDDIHDISEKTEEVDRSIAQEAKARQMYTDALARVVADTLALAAKMPDGKEEAVLQHIHTFLYGLEEQGFCYAGEVITRSTYISLN